MLYPIDISSVLFSSLGIQTENMALIYCTIEPAVDGILFVFLDSLIRNDMSMKLVVTRQQSFQPCLVCGISQDALERGATQH